jgi:hypothetical protein
MAPELQVLLTVFGLALFFSFVAVRYFLRQARRNGTDRMLALRNGLLLALVLFAGSILVYDAIKPTRVVEQDESAWCEKHPQECNTPPPLFSTY